ncbi:hypothetical protein BDV97DRAFT_369388 [Delphinella strobiligena]|nr:hypothetical protein BDV97DRAFT_369388 [Delphinella strobiligena]
MLGGSHSMPHPSSSSSSSSSSTSSAIACPMPVLMTQRILRRDDIRLLMPTVNIGKDNQGGSHRRSWQIYIPSPQARRLANFPTVSSDTDLLVPSATYVKKPYSAVSVQIDRLTSEQFEEDDWSGIIDLIEVIRIQASGPTEAARALRKKLKYGNPHRQIRALVILDGLIQNAGGRFQKGFADEPLMERLRILPQDDMVDKHVRDKCNVLFRQWAVAYKDTPGLSQIATLYKQLPQKRRPQQSQSKVLRETEAEAQLDERDNPLRDPSPPPAPKSHSRSSSNVTPSSSSTTPSRPVTLSSTPHFYSSSKKDKSKKDKRTKFNLEKEKPQIMQAIASASVASTNLLNGLQLINRETQRVSENKEVVKRFETCKALRRQILRYIQLVESDDWIGSLLSANDELVKALMGYEIMDKSLEDDRDSDGWERPSAEDYIAAAKFEAQRTGAPAGSTAGSATEQLAGLKLEETQAPAKPPRPGAIAMPAHPNYDELESESEPEDDEDDPFGDSKAVKTPRTERAGMTWRDV